MVHQQPIACAAQPPSAQPDLLKLVSNLFCGESQCLTAARLDTLDFVRNLFDKDLELALMAERESSFNDECFMAIRTDLRVAAVHAVRAKRRVLPEGRAHRQCKLPKRSQQCVCLSASLTRQNPSCALLPSF